MNIAVTQPKHLEDGGAIEPLGRRKFADPDRTATGEERAAVAFSRFRTLWFNTGTLCNLTCGNCYIESSPTNDRLAYLSAAEVSQYLDEVAGQGWDVPEIGFTGGEPFLNPEFVAMLRLALEWGHRVLVLTNAMRPMMIRADELLELRERYGKCLVMRVSLDHYSRAIHQTERGPRSWEPAIKGLAWLSDNGFNVRVAGRTFTGEGEEAIRQGFARLFATLGVEIDADDPNALVLFPEMDATADVPEISAACWDKLDVEPSSLMCSSSRMVVKRKGDIAPVVMPCTLIPYDNAFGMGRTLAASLTAVKLNHPHCARFCVLGGGSCSAPGANE